MHHTWLADERMLGDGEFVNAVLMQAEEQMVQRQRIRKEGWDIDRLVRTVCQLLSVDQQDFLRKSKKGLIAKEEGYRII